MTDETTLARPEGRALTVITKPQQVLAVHQHWLEAKIGELDRAEAAVKALRQLGARPTRIRLARERVRFLRRFVMALQHGYVPVPRFDSEKLELELDELPAEAMVAAADAKAKRLFDEIRYVTGRQAESRPGSHWDSRGRWSRASRGARDPLLVGVIRTPEHRVPDPRWPDNRQSDRVIPSRSEAFLIAWWRPEDMTDADLF